MKQEHDAIQKEQERVLAVRKICIYTHTQHIYGYMDTYKSSQKVEQKDKEYGNKTWKNNKTIRFIL